MSSMNKVLGWECSAPDRLRKRNEEGSYQFMRLWMQISRSRLVQHLCKSFKFSGDEERREYKSYNATDMHVNGSRISCGDLMSVLRTIEWPGLVCTFRILWFPYVWFADFRAGQRAEAFGSRHSRCIPGCSWQGNRPSSQPVASTSRSDKEVTKLHCVFASRSGWITRCGPSIPQSSQEGDKHFWACSGDSSTMDAIILHPCRCDDVFVCTNHVCRRGCATHHLIE